MSPTTYRFDWRAYWGNVAELTGLQDEVPGDTVAFYRTVSEIEPDGTLDALEAEIVGLSDHGLAWALGGSTASYGDLHTHGAPEALLEAIDRITERLEQEAESRGLYSD